MAHEQILQWNNKLAELLPKLKISENGKYSNLRFKRFDKKDWIYGTNANYAKEFIFHIEYIYEIIEEPEMIPLDFTDILDIMGKWLVDGRKNSGNNECTIIYYVANRKEFEITYRDHFEYISFQDLQTYFTFRDTGKRLEKKK